MFELYQRPYKKDSINSFKNEKSLTNRSLTSEDHHVVNGLVAPWSGDDYYCKVKQEIKNRHTHKRSSTSHALCEHFQDSKRRDLSKRIHTVNLNMGNIIPENSKFNWNTILPKKLSTKIIPKELIFSNRFQDIQKNEKVPLTPSSNQDVLSHRRESHKQIASVKSRVERFNSEANYKKIKNWREEKNDLNREHDRKNFLFFFQARNGNKVGNRQKMITKIRNLERGKVEKAMTTNNY